MLTKEHQPLNGTKQKTDVNNSLPEVKMNESMAPGEISFPFPT